MNLPKVLALGPFLYQKLLLVNKIGQKGRQHNNIAFFN